jgi:hypothetical protein
MTKLGRIRVAGMHTAVIARSDSDEAIHASACCDMDCFAEPVIGRAFARPVGSQ